MVTHHVRPGPATLRGYLTRDLPPILTMDPGDRVCYQTLDAAWGALEQTFPLTEAREFGLRDRTRDVHHALSGPVAVRGAEPGMTLAIHFRRIRTGRWGWSAGPELPGQLDSRLGVSGGTSSPDALICLPQGRRATFWELDPERTTATSPTGFRLRLRPFMGYVGTTPDQPGIVSTFPPTACGGNMDCKELVEGSRLYLPVALPGGLLWVGDGHATQGDGEVAGPALACPMDPVEIEVHLHPEVRLTMPRAHTPAGWITFGFHADLNEAAVQATVEMVKLMGELYGLKAKEALALAGLVVDLRITQIVNGVRGVHAILPHGAIENAAWCGS
jgi:acetamidase/formamidase